MSTNLIISRNGGLIEAEVDGELVALHAERGKCFGFNRSATRIWRLAERPISLDALCDALMAEYSVDRARCEAEVTEVVRDLEREGLLSVTEGGSSPLAT